MGTPVTDLPERMNAATYLLEGSVEAGRGERSAIHDPCHGSTYTSDLRKPRV